VTNLIQIKPTATPAAVKRKIENAFQRNAAIHASHIAVEEAGGAVTHVGLISSWAERDEAECAAWPAPGVTWSSATYTKSGRDSNDGARCTMGHGLVGMNQPVKYR